MNLSEVSRLLDPSPMPLETGYERLADGILHVCTRTDMHGCTGKMFEWWFQFRPDTSRYKWWHPIDHGPSNWAKAQEGTHISSEHIVEEKIAFLPMRPLIIQFRDPSEFFDMDHFNSALSEGKISGAVVGRTGRGHTPPRQEDGALLGGRLLHIPRDTEWGCVLRSHFFSGQDLPAAGMSPEQVREEIPDEVGQALVQHAYEEFTFLSRILPALYAAENHPEIPVSRPW